MFAPYLSGAYRVQAARKGEKGVRKRGVLQFHLQLFKLFRNVGKKEPRVRCSVEASAGVGSALRAGPFASNS